MNSEVKIEIVNEAKCFTYKGIEVDRETWESAPSPICCEKITDEDMCAIARTLHDVLVSVFGIVDVNKYVNKTIHGVNFNDFDKIDEFRWREEENLILDYGGKYYEDMETGIDSRFS